MTLVFFPLNMCRSVVQLDSVKISGQDADTRLPACRHEVVVSERVPRRFRRDLPPRWTARRVVVAQAESSSAILPSAPSTPPDSPDTHSS